jgi:predicted ATP-grasp superfamily ATP-dependent carboligase
MRQIACVESEFIVPGVIYVGGKLRHPFRLYSNNEGTICVRVCETPILVRGIHRVLDAVMKWALDSNVKNVLTDLDELSNDVTQKKGTAIEDNGNEDLSVWQSKG